MGAIGPASAGNPAAAAEAKRKAIECYLLQTIVAGSRDPALADAPDLHYTMAAEIHFLLEMLEKHAAWMK